MSTKSVKPFKPKPVIPNFILKQLLHDHKTCIHQDKWRKGYYCNTSNDQSLFKLSMTVN